jgi:hypothetical protein
VGLQLVFLLERTCMQLLGSDNHDALEVVKILQVQQHQRAPSWGREDRAPSEHEGIALTLTKSAILSATGLGMQHHN